MILCFGCCPMHCSLFRRICTLYSLDVSGTLPTVVMPRMPLAENQGLRGRGAGDTTLQSFLRGDPSAEKKSWLGAGKVSCKCLECPLHFWKGFKYRGMVSGYLTTPQRVPFRGFWWPLPSSLCVSSPRSPVGGLVRT